MRGVVDAGLEQGDRDGIFSGGNRTPAPVRGRMRSISNRFLMLSLVAMLVCAAVFYAREVGQSDRRIAV
jgi:hypothetical protein